jgi:hypothetical protein
VTEFLVMVRERPPFHIEPDPDDIHVECDKQIAALTAALEQIRHGWGDTGGLRKFIDAALDAAGGA